MNSPTTPNRGSHSERDRSYHRRTTFLTVAAIVGVMFAGSAAVVANVGILNAADNSTIGKLAATDDLVPAVDAAAGEDPTVTPVVAPPTTAVATPSTTTVASPPTMAVAPPAGATPHHDEDDHDEGHGDDHEGADDDD